MVVDDAGKATFGVKQKHPGSMVHRVVPVSRHLLEPGAEPRGGTLHLSERAGQASDPRIEVS